MAYVKQALEHGRDCPDCGTRQHYAPLGTEGGPAWYHDNLLDAWQCAGLATTQNGGVSA